MAAGGTFKSMAAFATKFKRDMNRLESGMDRARMRAARKTAAYVRAHVPVAFGELRDAVREEGSKVICDAPHAIDVELGSRPHWVPLEPLIKWVQLRGFQSLVATKSRERLPGTTTLKHANAIGKRLESARDGAAFSAPDSVVQIAKGIQFGISKHGTKPHFFMRNAVPQAREFLSVEISAVFTKL